jgi:hypothetical protein
MDLFLKTPNCTFTQPPETGITTFALIVVRQFFLWNRGNPKELSSGALLTFQRGMGYLVDNNQSQPPVFFSPDRIQLAMGPKLSHFKHRDPS